MEGRQRGSEIWRSGMGDGGLMPPRPKTQAHRGPTAAVPTPTLVPGPTPFTSQPDSGGMDTTLISWGTGSNQGTNSVFYLGTLNRGTGHGLIKFDLSSIPQGATITDATLSLWVAVDNATAAGVLCSYRIKQNWTEDGATWNNYDGANPWNTAGGYGSADAEQASLGCANTTASQAVGSEIQIPLSPTKIKEIVDGFWVDRGLMLRYVDESATNRYQFYSSDETTYTARRPKLVIHYSVGIGPTATATATPMPPPSGSPQIREFGGRERGGRVTGAYTYDSARPHAVSTVTYTDLRLRSARGGNCRPLTAAKSTTNR